jgi:chorismate mutase
MPVRGIRGAITTPNDQPQLIREATQILLKGICEANPCLNSEDIASVIFTVTEDLVSDYPAHAAREFGWTQVPLLCTREIPVPNSLNLCIRVLIQWNTDLPQASIRHVYLRDAVALRPDLKKNQ